MTLRRKSVIILAMALTGLVAILYTISQSVLLNSFATLEKQDTSRNVERALEALSTDISSLVTMTRDWAAWDDTYNFIEDHNQAYIEANPTDQTIEGLRVNVMLFMDSSGQIVFSKAFDLQNRVEVSVPQSLLEQITPDSMLVHHPDTDSSVSGMILLPDGPMLTSSQPILTSQGEGPIRGALVWGRYLDAAEVDRLAETTRLSLATYRLDQPQLPQDFESARSSLVEGTPVIVQPLSKETVVGYTLIKDIYGTPVLMLRAEMPRAIYQQGLASSRYLILSVLGVGLVFVLLTFVLLERLVLSRVLGLAKNVADIGKRNDISARVSLTGKDELSNLAHTMNETLAVLEHTQNELTESREALKTSERKLRYYLESSPDAIFVHDADGKLLYVNKRMERITGYARNELLGQSFTELRMLPAGYLDKSTREQQLKIAEELTSPEEFELMRKDGSRVSVEISAYPIGQSDNIEVIGIARDITERKRIEQERAKAEALRQSEEKFRRLVEEMNDGYCVVQDRKIVFVNAIGAKMFGYSREDIVDKAVEKFLSPQIVKELRAVYSTPQPNQDGLPQYQVTLTKKDGTPIPVELGGRLTQYASRSAVSLVIRDITERKIAEEKLKQTLAELERSNKELQQFAYVASHDLQEPLRMVASYTQLLAERYKGKLDDKADVFINYAVDGSTRMQGLINDLLFYSRVTTRAKPFKPTDFNLVLVRSLTNLGVAIKDSDALITSDDLPIVMADESQMGQVFQNLIGNAMKFRREEQPRVHISVKEERGEWVFLVEDNGIGIEQEYTERIFVLFQRLHNRSKYPGTGIGLTLCKKIVERHGGRIWVESKPGVGSKFYFTIPKKGIGSQNKLEELLGVKHVQ